MAAFEYDWPTVLWSVVVGICSVLAVINCVVWLSRRQASSHGIFALMAACTAALAAGELALMHSESIPAYIAILRWSQVPVFILTLSMAGFVLVYLRAGRLWLAVTACSLRAISLVINFAAPEGLFFSHVTALKEIPFLDASVTIAVGERNPWMALAQVSLLILLVFILDAALSVWRRGERRKALVAGGALVGFVFLGVFQAVLCFWGLFEMPLTPSLFFSGMVIVMGFELSRDIMRAEELATRVREGERHLALAAAAANLGIWTRDYQSDEIWASPQWRTLFGFAESAPITIGAVMDRIHPEDRRLIETTLGNSDGTKTSYELEYRIVRPDGQTRWISSRGVFESHGKNRPQLSRGVSIDITLRKESERALQEQRTELAHLSRVTMLGELSGSLAHELNQPLTAILSNAQAAQRFITQPEIDRQELAEILQDIVEADQRAGEVIRSLRALFKKGPSDRQLVSLNSVIKDVLKLVRSDALNQGVMLRMDLDTREPIVVADPIQLQQVLLNLILNALDALASTPEKNRHLFVSSLLQADGCSRVAVRDHGTGIPDDLREKIFEPFFTTKAHGLGLGLGVCRSILEAHRSKLTVANAPDGGAEFSFILSPSEVAS